MEVIFSHCWVGQKVRAVLFNVRGSVALVCEARLVSFIIRSYAAGKVLQRIREFVSSFVNQFSHVNFCS